MLILLQDCLELNRWTKLVLDQPVPKPGYTKWYSKFIRRHKMNRYYKKKLNKELTKFIEKVKPTFEELCDAADFIKQAEIVCHMNNIIDKDSPYVQLASNNSIKKANEEFKEIILFVPNSYTATFRMYYDNEQSVISIHSKGNRITTTAKIVNDQYTQDDYIITRAVLNMYEELTHAISNFIVEAYYKWYEADDTFSFEGDTKN